MYTKEIRPLSQIGAEKITISKKKFDTDRQMDVQTDRGTDEQTDILNHRVASLL